MCGLGRQETAQLSIYACSGCLHLAAMFFGCESQLDFSVEFLAPTVCFLNFHVFSQLFPYWRLQYLSKDDRIFQWLACFGGEEMVVEEVVEEVQVVVG